MDTKKRRGVVVLTNQMKLRPFDVGWALLQGTRLTRENAMPVREIVGVGVGLDLDAETGELLIKKVFPQSPAFDSKLLAGSVIQKIDGQSVVGKDLQQCLAMLGGPAGKKVMLQIVGPNQNGPISVEVTRRKFLTIPE